MSSAPSRTQNRRIKLEYSEITAVITNFAAAALVMLGILIAVIGFLLASGNVTYVVIGLGAVAVGGVLGLIGRRVAS